MSEFRQFISGRNRIRIIFPKLCYVLFRTTYYLLFIIEEKLFFFYYFFCWKDPDARTRKLWIWILHKEKTSQLSRIIGLHIHIELLFTKSIISKFKIYVSFLESRTDLFADNPRDVEYHLEFTHPT